MVSSHILCAFGAVVSLAHLAAADSVLLPRAAFEAFGIVKEEGTTDNEAAKWAPHALFGAKNATEQLLKGRSLDLEERQTCNTGYGYCSCKSCFDFLNIIRPWDNGSTGLEPNLESLSLTKISLW
jgi:hypothetical protein